MNKRKDYQYVVSICIIYMIFFSCSKTQPINRKIISKDDLPTLSVDNVVRNITQHGKMKGKMQAPLMNVFDGIVGDTYYDFPKGISILMFKDDKIETSARANHVVFYDQKKTWEATGDVVISNINGDVMQTQKLYGDDKVKRIFTDKFVKITKADGTVLFNKKGFESNEEFTIYQFVDVSGRIAFKDELVDSTTVSN